nr:uncharacterized protein Dmel_CG14932, isoform B [Drosophila melanogaster]ACZ94243.1 uncharacterized protein Dmel_CG14932, isoform B [Drosophila melanogaster]|eukprot:NP_001162956.1 uncharacterized protein Dmel_CG14932, isoform B [Drosophila melanogaster]
MSQSKVPHIVGDDDEYQEATAPESDEITCESSVESDQDDDCSNEDDMDLDGADWSPYVTYEAGTPRRPHSALEITEITEFPKIPKKNPTSPELVIQKPETPDQNDSGSQERLTFSRANNALSESIGARVSQRSRGNLEPFIRRMARSPTPEASEENGSVSQGQLLAKPVDVTEFFHRIAVGLVEQRVCLKPFLALRKHIAQLVGQTLKKSKRMRR